MDNAKYVTFLVIVLGTISTLGSPIKDLSPKLNPELPSSDKVCWNREYSEGLTGSKHLFSVISCIVV